MRNVWAIAKNTLAQAIRMKLAVIVVFLLVVILPVMSTIVTGDGTLVGKLQTFSSYGLSLMSLMLCVLTIAVSCYTLNSDIKNKQIFMLLTKPVYRSQVVAGKFLGVLVLDLILVAVFSGIIYGLTVSMPKFADAPDAEVKQAQSEFFTARIGLKPKADTEKIEKRVLERYNELKDRNDSMLERKRPEEIKAMLRGQEKMKAMSVEPGGMISWEFEDVYPKDRDGSLFIRFKYDVSVDPPDLNVYSRWFAGDSRPLKKGEKPKTPIYDSYIRKDVVRTAREIEIPANVVAKDGYIELGFQNIYYNRTTVIPQEIEVLYRSGTFTSNFFRAAALILVRVVFLGALGVSISCWLSFPVALFVSIVVYLTGTVNGFIMESFDSLNIGASLVYMFTVKPLLSLLPAFDGEFNPTPMIVSSKFIGWFFLAKVIFVTAIFKPMIMMLVGIYIFSRREIAKVTV